MQGTCDTFVFVYFWKRVCEVDNVISISVPIVCVVVWRTFQK